MKPPYVTRLHGAGEGHARHGRPEAAQASRSMSWLARLLRDWQRRARGRNELGRLDARQLRDVGLSVEQLARETAKPFWRA